MARSLTDEAIFTAADLISKAMAILKGGSFDELFLISSLAVRFYCG